MNGDDTTAATTEAAQAEAAALPAPVPAPPSLAGHENAAAVAAREDVRAVLMLIHDAAGSGGLPRTLIRLPTLRLLTAAGLASDGETGVILTAAGVAAFTGTGRDTTTAGPRVGTTEGE